MKNESFEWFESHYCINQYCNEHEFILDILEVNIRGRKLSNFRFEFGDFNSKLIHFFGFSQTGSDHFFAEFLEKFWYCEFGLKDTLTIFNFCQKSEITISKYHYNIEIAVKIKNDNSIHIWKNSEFEHNFGRVMASKKTVISLTRKNDFWQTFKLTLVSLICTFSEMNSFCLWVTAKKMTLMTKVGVNILLSTIFFWKNLLTSYYPSWPFSMSFFLQVFPKFSNYSFISVLIFLKKVKFGFKPANFNEI